MSHSRICLLLALCVTGCSREPIHKECPKFDEHGNCLPEQSGGGEPTASGDTSQGGAAGPTGPGAPTGGTGPAGATGPTDDTTTTTTTTTGPPGGGAGGLGGGGSGSSTGKTGGTSGPGGGGNTTGAEGAGSKKQKCLKQASDSHDRCTAQADSEQKSCVENQQDNVTKLCTVTYKDEIAVTVDDVRKSKIDYDLYYPQVCAGKKISKQQCLELIAARWTEDRIKICETDLMSGGFFWDLLMPPVPDGLICKGYGQCCSELLKPDRSDCDNQYTKAVAACLKS